MTTVAKRNPTPGDNGLSAGSYSEPCIVKDEDTCDGKARIGGTRIPVWVLAFDLAHGRDDQWLLDQFPRLTPGALLAAKDYIRTHADEIAADLAENAAP